MPDHSTSPPTDRVGPRNGRGVVRWLQATLPAWRPKADLEPARDARNRSAGSRVKKPLDRPAVDAPDNPYVHYRNVKEALQRANLDFAASVGANASHRIRERLARRVSRLQVQEDEAVEAMRRQDRSWSVRGLLGVFQHSDGTVG